ncbi:hypothetical protein J6590_057092 [Homalodisca vitripennis]|nr:hypothetical protein J6590_057092 [Homalodisca vitripennis]
MGQGTKWGRTLCPLWEYISFLDLPKIFHGYFLACNETADRFAKEALSLGNKEETAASSKVKRYCAFQSENSTRPWFCHVEFSKQDKVVRLYNNKFPDVVVDRAYMRRLVYKFTTTFNLNDAPRSVRPSTFTKEDEIGILVQFTVNPHSILLMAASEVNISKSTIQRVLKKHKFQPYKVELHQEIHHTQHPQKLSVWAGILENSVIGPFFIDGNLNGPQYLGMLQRNIVPAIYNITQGIYDPFFQHDGAPPYYDINVRTFLDQVFPERWIGRRGAVE